MENNQSIDNEFGTDSQSMKERRGTFLLVLCILSFIFTGISLFNSTYTFVDGEAKFGEKIDLINEGVGVPFLDQAMAEAIPELELILANFSNYHIANTLLFIIGILAVTLMFKLKKVGFYIYIFYSVLALFIQNLFLGELPSNTLTLTFGGFVSIVFILLYAKNTNRMTE